MENIEQEKDLEWSFFSSSVGLWDPWLARSICHGYQFYLFLVISWSFLAVCIFLVFIYYFEEKAKKKIKNIIIVLILLLVFHLVSSRTNDQLKSVYFIPMYNFNMSAKINKNSWSICKSLPRPQFLRCVLETFFIE